MNQNFLLRLIECLPLAIIFKLMSPGKNQFYPLKLIVYPNAASN